MNEFINSLDIGRFESTNGLWNDLMLNDPWSVGYVTTLIETKNSLIKKIGKIITTVLEKPEKQNYPRLAYNISKNLMTSSWFLKVKAK